MRVRLGWSGETEANKWAKADVELEEEDLRRLLTSNGIDAALLDRLPVRLCYALMEAEAESHLLLRLTRQHGYPKDAARVRLAELDRIRDEIIDGLKTLTAS